MRAGAVAIGLGARVDERARHRASEARISIFDTGFGHSDLTYTVAHVWHGNIFRLGDHLDRLLDGARKLRLEPGYSKDELAAVAPIALPKCIAWHHPQDRVRTGGRHGYRGEPA